MKTGFQVTSYQYYNWSSRSKGKSNLLLYGVEGEKCAVWFEEDEKAKLPKAKKGSGEVYTFYYHHSQLQHLIDMLRFEKPIHVFYNDGPYNNSCISTGHEPVGEGEEH